MLGDRKRAVLIRVSRVINVSQDCRPGLLDLFRGVEVSRGLHGILDR